MRDPEGFSRFYTYDAAGDLATYKDAEGATTHFTYAADHYLKSMEVASADGAAVTKVLENVWDGGRLVRQLDADGKEIKYEHDLTARRETFRDRDGNPTVYEYDLLSSRLKKLTVVPKDDPTHPRVTTYEYNEEKGWLERETGPDNNVTTYFCDPRYNRRWQSVTRRKPDGTSESLVTWFEHDRNNRLVKTTNPDNTFTTVVYNELGRQASVKDQSGRETKYEYDAKGNLKRTIYPDGKYEDNSYDDDGRRTSSTDRAVRTTFYKHDRVGRLTETLFAGGGKTTTTYDGVGRVLTQSRWLDATTKHTTTYRYEAEGKNRVVYVKDALGRETKQVFDEAGNLWKVTDAKHHTTVYEYDKDDRRVKTTYHDATFETTAYDGFGQVVAKTDQASRTTRFRYDAAGRLVKVIDAADKETTYGYETDKVGRRTKRTLPEGMSELFTYEDGRLKTRTDFNGKTTTYGFDELNRLVTKTPDASFGLAPVTYTYTAAGRRETMTDATGVTTYTYDARDRLLTKQAPQGTLTYTYDKLGNLKTVRSSNAEGVSVDYGYDELSRLSAVTDNRLAENNVTSYTYDEVGNLDSYTYGNGVKSAYTYNDLNRLTNLTMSKAAATLSSYAYTLGAAGNRESVTEAGGRKAVYTYDALYRLEGETVTGDAQGVNGAVGYDYDDAGNRLARTSTLPGVAAQKFTYDKNDRLTSDTYDANGSTKQSGGVAYVYDWENRLSSVGDGAVTYQYDGDGNRVAKTVGGVTTTYLVDANSLTGYAQVAEELQGGQVVRQYTYGHDLVSQRQLLGGQWSLSYYGYDGHGSVRTLTDAAGAVTDTYTYDAFGSLTAATGGTPNEYLYAGERFDPETGLYHLRARQMSPHADRPVLVDGLFRRAQRRPGQ